MVLAAGSQPNFFHTPGAEEFAFPLYSLDDAKRIRSRVLQLFQDASERPELVEEGALTFVVVGGGATGVEVGGRARGVAAQRHASRLRASGDRGRRVDPRRPRPHGARSLLRRSSRLRREATPAAGGRAQARRLREGDRGGSRHVERRDDAQDAPHGLGRRAHGRSALCPVGSEPGSRRAPRRSTRPDRRGLPARVRARRLREHPVRKR